MRTWWRTGVNLVLKDLTRSFACSSQFVIHKALTEHGGSFSTLGSVCVAEKSQLKAPINQIWSSSEKASKWTLSWDYYVTNHIFYLTANSVVNHVVQFYTGGFLFCAVLGSHCIHVWTVWRFLRGLLSLNYFLWGGKLRNAICKYFLSSTVI